MDPRNLMPDLNAFDERDGRATGATGADGGWFPELQMGLPSVFEETYAQAAAAAAGGGYGGIAAGGDIVGSWGGTEGFMETSAAGAAPRRGRAARGLPAGRNSAGTRGGRRGGGAYRPPRSMGAGTGTSADGVEATTGATSDTTQFETENFEQDKADWNSTNTRIFCELCVVETEAGNRPSGIMSSRGFKNIARQYFASTGLRHKRQQLKNRWDTLKGLYGFWCMCRKQSGLGWDNEKGTVTASDSWWKANTKKRPECKKVKNGPPEHLELLELMFHGTVVDGSSSCIPGEDLEGEDEEQQTDPRCERSMDERATGEDSPRSTNQGKRGSTFDSATSPVKKSKSPLVKIMKDIRDNMQINNAIANKVLQGETKKKSIKEVMALAVASGATEGTVEHFMASQLFVKEEHRYVFETLETNEGRLNWLRMWCKQKGLM